MFAHFEERERAFAALDRALDDGFILYRNLMRWDPWLDPIRSYPEFSSLLERAESRYRRALAAFRNVGGDELLGVKSVLTNDGKDS